MNNYLFGDLGDRWIRLIRENERERIGERSSLLTVASEIEGRNRGREPGGRRRTKREEEDERKKEGVRNKEKSERGEIS
uniref:Uncharacterized protein n=1 Tax=Nelumbo nucifera TaxID=4432 RepID=A0A822ZVU1_NELNU|nr:TPA_asm: hypothetical protein HUJ06_017326 [Nelumbo nucifera]